MLSSGVRNLARLVGGWMAAFTLVAVSIVHLDDIRSALGLTLDPRDLGAIVADEQPEPEARTVAPEAENEPRRQVDRFHHRRAAAAPRDGMLFTQSVHLARGRDGHFHADATINGRTIPVLVDTGATLVALSYEDAVAAGISVGPGDFRYVSHTANGQARFARVTLDHVRIGNVVVHNVAAAVSQPGRLRTTLLGMSFLGQLRMEMKGGLLVLEQ